MVMDYLQIVSQWLQMLSVTVGEGKEGREGTDTQGILEVIHSICTYLSGWIPQSGVLIFTSQLTNRACCIAEYVCSQSSLLLFWKVHFTRYLQQPCFIFWPWIWFIIFVSIFDCGALFVFEFSWSRIHSSKYNIKPNYTEAIFLDYQHSWLRLSACLFFISFISQSFD